MPYAIKKQGNVWITYNKITGKIKGRHKTKAKALAQMRLLYHIEHGGKLTKRSTRGSKPFTQAELAKGYRRLK